VLGDPASWAHLGHRGEERFQIDGSLPEGTALLASSPSLVLKTNSSPLLGPPIPSLFGVLRGSSLIEYPPNPISLPSMQLKVTSHSLVL
jgi:hypothetical protein